MVRARDTTARESAHLGLVVRKFALVGVGRLAEAVDLQRLRVLVAVDRHEAGTQRRFGRPHRAHELVPLPLANHVDRQLHVVRVGSGHVDEAVGVVHHEQRSGTRLGGAVRLGAERATASPRDDDGAARAGRRERRTRVARLRERDRALAARRPGPKVAAAVLDRGRPTVDEEMTERAGVAERALARVVAARRAPLALKVEPGLHLGDEEDLSVHLEEVRSLPGVVDQPRSADLFDTILAPAPLERAEVALSDGERVLRAADRETRDEEELDAHSRRSDCMVATSRERHGRPARPDGRQDLLVGSI